ncbi:MAG: 50S ribosomal protein L15 [Nitrospira sp.]|nr:50S ribosomal protein L15 [bacterium]MBL7049310.1 50S ribosomal protein L15 [Nitrospira sp.]
MELSELAPSEGSTKKRKRVGRGPGSGHGKTSCRGHKGQNARSGGGVKPGFEGGQMPLQRRLPKRGFTNIFAKQISIVNVGDLDRLTDEMITPEVLLKEGLVSKIGDGVKILGNGEVTKPLKIRVHAISSGARDKIINAQGNIEMIPKKQVFKKVKAGAQA